MYDIREFGLYLGGIGETLKVLRKEVIQLDLRIGKLTLGCSMETKRKEEQMWSQGDCDC